MTGRGMTLTAWAVGMGLAGVAGAQPLTGTLRFQVSYDGSFWSSEIGIDNGMTFKIRAVAEWTDGATPSVGFEVATLEQIDLSGARFDDTFDVAGAYRRQVTPPETWTLQPGTGGSLGGLKIDNVNPINRINVDQLPKVIGPTPNPAFSAANPLVVFQMDCRYGFFHGDNITVSGEWARLGSPASNEFKVYTTETGSSKKPVQEAVIVPALVRYVGPTPGTTGAFFIAAAAVGRRRRK